MESLQLRPYTKTDLSSPDLKSATDVNFDDIEHTLFQLQKSVAEINEEVEVIKAAIKEIKENIKK